MFRAHVLIIRRSKLYYTASGIITHIGDRLVHRMRETATAIKEGGGVRQNTAVLYPILLC